MIELKGKQRIVVVNENEEYFLVKKAELKELLDQLNNQPQWATGMKWMQKQTGYRSPQFIKENILFPYKEELEEIVAFPEENGQWRFHIAEVQKWLNQKSVFNFHKKVKK